VLIENTGAPTDIVRFDNDTVGGLAYFFSDLPEVGELPVPFADTGIPPFTPLPSVVVPELGTEGNNGATYFAANGSPGCALIGGAIQPVTYGILSDSTVPEPATMSLLALGGLAVLKRGLSRRRS
ncbi:MAG: PEP-CTERM sorting domain-containing protein, partial [Planctomycetota bacterium]|nr:PEP-CTERM sorting domain-containing protein [Planctomycetota bacterium]